MAVKQKTQEIWLDIEIESLDFDKSITLRGYLKELLRTMWIKGEGFSGKRPFGNSGWKYDVYGALIQNKIIEGSLDEDGYVKQIDTKEADEIIVNLIVNYF